MEMGRGNPRVGTTTIMGEYVSAPHAPLDDLYHPCRGMATHGGWMVGVDEVWSANGHMVARYGRPAYPS